MNRRTCFCVAVLLAIVVVACTPRPRFVYVAPVGPAAPLPTPVAIAPSESALRSVLAAIGPDVHARLAPYFKHAGIAYPPRELALLAFKRERRLEIWARSDGAWARIDAYPILAASGVAGPKLRWGDRQVPEGLYRVIALNPNSAFHLSMMLDYPNSDDLAEAARAGRVDLGGDIFIHGGARSIGCLAIGDRNIEGLFVLVAEVGLEHVQVVIAPHDPRDGVALGPIAGLDFTYALYVRITDRLRDFPVPPAERASP
jgi:hypothetical protein